MICVPNWSQSVAKPCYLGHTSRKGTETLRKLTLLSPTAVIIPWVGLSSRIFFSVRSARCVSIRRMNAVSAPPQQQHTTRGTNVIEYTSQRHRHCSLRTRTSPWYVQQQQQQVCVYCDTRTTDTGNNSRQRMEDGLHAEVAHTTPQRRTHEHPTQRKRKTKHDFFGKQLWYTNGGMPARTSCRVLKYFEV